jgi:hypothetical protein
MGFANIRQWPEAEDAGQSWVTGFRKAANSVTTTAAAWTDYSFYAGSPPANFYASTPLEAAYIPSDRGIYVPSVSPATQHLRNLKLMTASSSATSINPARQQIILIDLLMYYPFIDMDAVGEQQEMINAVEIPRYAGGQVVAVAQSASSAVGKFSFTYTNDEGVAGRVSQQNFTFVVSGGGQVAASSVGYSGSYHPFCHLQAGDKGVKSIESVTFTAAGGGLMALVIVQPLLTAYVTQECRRTTTGNLESYGSCSEFAAMINSRPARIIDGAVLNLLAAGFVGSLASSTLVGLLETTWN